MDEPSQSEHRAAHEQALLRIAGRVAKVGAWAIRLPELVIEWSDETAALFDAPIRGELPVEHALESVVAEDRDRVRDAFLACLRDGRSFDIEVRIVTRAGRHVWMRSIGEACHDAAGVIIRVQGALQDISEQKAAAEEIRSLASRLLGTLETITDPFFTVDREWRLTFLNPAAAQLMGRGRPALIGRHLWTEFPDAVGTAYHEGYHRAMDLGVPVNFEAGYASYDRWFEVRAYPTADGLAVWLRDVTELRKNREALRESEARFRLLSRATHDAVWEWNPVTGALWCGDGFTELFGFRTDEVGPTIAGWKTRLHPDDCERVELSLRAALDGDGASWGEEYRFLCRDGAYAWVLDRGYVIRDGNGVGIRMIGGMTDITQRRKLEAQVLRAQRMESIGALAGGIAHDLNNTLAPILWTVSVMLEEEQEARRREDLATIEACTRRSADMVRQLLTFARGADGERTHADPTRIAREVLRIVRDTFPRDITLEACIAEAGWSIHAEPTQIHQVLMNLCLNARDAMPRGGTLGLTVTLVMLDAVFVASNVGAAEGPYVRLRVEDTGTGIPLDVQERMFDPFFTTKAVGRGTGLGLSTAHAIVKGHGGFIHVDSEPGRGTRIDVWLPADPITQADEVPEPLPGLRGAGELVLVVDDEEAIRAVASRTLEQYGYRVLVAADGAEAVSTWLRHREEIAVVITDMTMPVLDGPGTIAALQELDPGVRVIASSGFDGHGYRERVLAAGVRHFVPKPYTAEVILRALRDVIEGD